jgi:hypothetical protein
VIVANCEGLRLTVACSRLIIRNCLDCAFYPAVLSAPLIIGDCRGLRFGPHDMVYASLASHLALVGLPTDWAGINRWNDVVEVESYLDKNTNLIASGRSSGGESAIRRTDFRAGSSFRLACLSSVVAELSASSPSAEAIVSFVSPQHFVVRAVPVAEEAVRGEVGPIPPEGAYTNALRSRGEVLGLLEARVQQKGIPSVDWTAFETALSDSFMVRGVPPRVVAPTVVAATMAPHRHTLVLSVAGMVDHHRTHPAGD